MQNTDLSKESSNDKSAFTLDDYQKAIDNGTLPYFFQKLMINITENKMDINLGDKDGYTFLVPSRKSKQHSVSIKQ